MFSSSLNFNSEGMLKLNSVNQMLRNMSAVHCMVFGAQTQVGKGSSMLCVQLQSKQLLIIVGE